MLFTFKGPKSNLKLKNSSLDFWFEFLNIHMNEKKKTCHGYHGFKWQNINIYSILIIFLYGLTPFFDLLDYDYTQVPNKYK